jgi:DnaJ-class molecular chaperone
MEVNPWEVLGIPPDSSEETVKKTYRKLAMKHHPDKGGDPEQFKRIQSAYDRITKGEEEENQGPPTFPFGDMFANFFNGFQRQQEKQIHDINIDLRTAYHGHEVKLKVSDQIQCGHCKCQVCKGMGFVLLGPFQQMCPGCNSKKSTGCNACSKKGFTDRTREFTIHIKSGTPSGTVIEVTDIFDVRVVITKDPIFDFDGSNLTYTVPMSFKESLIGKTFVVPHVGGNFEYTTTTLIKPHKKYIVKGKGLSIHGDLILKFVIDYPEKLTDEQIEEIKKIFP